MSSVQQVAFDSDPPRKRPRTGEPNDVNVPITSASPTSTPSHVSLLQQKPSGNRAGTLFQSAETTGSTCNSHIRTDIENISGELGKNTGAGVDKSTGIDTGGNGLTSHTNKVASYKSTEEQVDNDEEHESTEYKLAFLASLHADRDPAELLEALLAADGSVAGASKGLKNADISRKENDGAESVTNAATEDPERTATTATYAKVSVSPSSTKYSTKRINTPSTVGIQSSLSSYYTRSNNTDNHEPTSSSPSNRSDTVTNPKPKKPKILTRRGRTLHLYSPADIAAHTPCTIIHNFLPAQEADTLLRELLSESPTYSHAHFRLFEREVQSPHTMCFYVEGGGGGDERDKEREAEGFAYNGDYLKDVRTMLPTMRAIKPRIRHTINTEIQRRIRDVYPGGQKLKYQSPEPWEPNAAFVNCYEGGAQSVGYHSDQLTYLGPRPTIGSLSLGVEREFRIRQTVPPDHDDDNPNRNINDDNTTTTNNINNQKNGTNINNHRNGKDNKNESKPHSRADIQGQIAIHLPHNSLLIMHAEMQESWKHAIAPALPPSAALVPHRVAGTKRLNITYRFYRPAFHPRFTPRCRCRVGGRTANSSGGGGGTNGMEDHDRDRGGVLRLGGEQEHARERSDEYLPTCLRCVQRQKGSKGRYMWMCHGGYAVGGEGCSFFQWADFDDDGDPAWAAAAREYAAGQKGAEGEGKDGWVHLSERE